MFQMKLQTECLRARGDLKVSDEAMDGMSQWWSEGFQMRRWTECLSGGLKVLGETMDGMSQWWSEGFR